MPLKNILDICIRAAIYYIISFANRYRGSACYLQDELQIYIYAK